MKEYIIEVTETLQRQIHVEANSEEDALQKIKNRYKTEEIVLDETDYVNTQFQIIVD